MLFLLSNINPFTKRTWFSISVHVGLLDYKEKGYIYQTQLTHIEFKFQDITEFEPHVFYDLLMSTTGILQRFNVN